MWRIFRRVAFVVVAGACVVATTALAPSTPPGWQVTDHARLADTPAAEITEFIASHPGLAREAFAADPVVVSDWWTSLSRDDRKELVLRLPQVIGNLAGVDFASRNTANRAALAVAIRVATALVARHPSDVQAAEQLAALEAIRGALAGAGAGRRYLIELTSDSPPLASIAIGKLDTAKLITFLVPGMGTLSTDMQLWTRAAQNVYDSQGTAGADKRRAVIAWVGYRTPPPGMDATRDTYATRGALLLNRDIAGVRAARGTHPQPVVNIVAHSYGATTAALALTQADLGVSTLVMLGSAGVDSSIRAVTDLHAAHVFVGEAAADQEARWGRINRRDPGESSFGASPLAVDGAKGLLGVTGHEPIVHSPWNDDPACPMWVTSDRGDPYKAHMASQGYLDVGTQSLRTVGVVSTPPATRERMVSSHAATSAAS